MKKWIAFLLALTCLLSLCACGDDPSLNSGTKNSRPGVSTPGQINSGETKPEDTKPEDTKPNQEDDKYVTVYLPVHIIYDNGTSEAYSYNEDGYKMVGVWYEGDEESYHYTYAYDKDGNMTGHVKYIHGEESLRTTLIYGEDGKPAEEIIYEYGKEIEHWTYTHDKYGNVIKAYFYMNSMYYTGDGPAFWLTFTYDNDGRRVKITLEYPHGTDKYERIIQYNQNDDITYEHEIFYTSSHGSYIIDHDIEWVYEYTYDDKGNITQAKVYRNGELSKDKSYTCYYIDVQMTRKQAEKLGYI